MATLEELRQAMEGMNAQLQHLQGELDQANARAQAADARADDANDRVMQALERVTAAGAGGKGRGNGGNAGTIPTLVDTRGIGRPDSFGKGDQRSLELMFPGWRRKTTNFLVSLYPSIKELLE